MIEKILNNGILLAIVIRASFTKEGIEFFTNDKDSQQLGYMKRPKDYIIPPHRHNLISREIHLTQEVLFIKSGIVRVDFYDNSQFYIKSIILKKDDVILLSDGGHGFQIIEDAEIIEVKQGPYCGEQDKIRFTPVDNNKINF
jgi:hypothetical protein